MTTYQYQTLQPVTHGYSQARRIARYHRRVGGSLETAARTWIARYSRLYRAHLSRRSAAV